MTFLDDATAAAVAERLKWAGVEGAARQARDHLLPKRLDAQGNAGAAEALDVALSELDRLVAIARREQEGQP